MVEKFDSKTCFKSCFIFFWNASTNQVNTDASGFLAWPKLNSTVRAFSITLVENNLQRRWRYLINSQICDLVALNFSWLSYQIFYHMQTASGTLFIWVFLPWVPFYKQDNLWVLFCKQENPSTSSSWKADACTIFHIHNSSPAGGC